MKLHLFFFVALCPVLVSAQSIFDLINPFFWIFSVILNIIIPPAPICGLVESALEGAIGKGDSMTCTCNIVANVFLVVPTGLTVGATCETNANLSLNNQAVTAGSFGMNLSIGFGDIGGLASGATNIAVNSFNGCLSISGNEVCANYAGSISGSTGFVLNTCDVDIGSQDCACEICENKASVKFNCAPGFPNLTSNGKCVSPALIG